MKTKELREAEEVPDGDGDAEEEEGKEQRNFSWACN
jgi:hypothetical protein